MAISLNGIIARENNEEDFLSHDNWITFVELARQTGCMIWGRKTHEVVRTWEKKYWNEIRGVRKVIVTSKPNFSIEEECVLASSPREALSKLEQEGFESVILTGGSTLNSSFAKDGLIDEVIVNIEPVVIGQGIPLFFPQEFELKLNLLNLRKVNSNLIQLHYRISK